MRHRAERRAAETRCHLDEVRDDAEDRLPTTGWATALDDVLDDSLLAEAVHTVAALLSSAVQRSAPIVRSHVLARGRRDQVGRVWKQLRDRYADEADDITATMTIPAAETELQFQQLLAGAGV